MNLITIAVAGAFTALMLFFAFFLLKSIYANLGSGREYRRTLEAKAETAPLGSMIRKLGMCSNDYLHQESVLTIRRQLHQCSHCPDSSTCLSWLQETPDVVTEAPAFCPNREHLGESRALLKEAS